MMQKKLKQIWSSFHNPQNDDDIKGISLPTGFRFLEDIDSSYTNWLLDLKFKKDNHVYLFDGNLKPNQDIHYSVLAIPIGKRNLLQCADAADKIKSGSFV